jgi:hypothetical protein
VYSDTPPSLTRFSGLWTKTLKKGAFSCQLGPL